MRILSLVSFLLCTFCTQSVLGKMDKADYIYTSYIRLVANPMEFADKQVRVVGVMCIMKDDEKYGIYLYDSKEKCALELLGEGIELELEEGLFDEKRDLMNYHNKYVEVWGEFFGKRSENDIVLVDYLGTIRRVVKVICLE